MYNEALLINAHCQSTDALNYILEDLGKIRRDCPNETEVWLELIFKGTIYTTIGDVSPKSVLTNLSSKFDRFLAAHSQFDTSHRIDFYAHTCYQSATFVRPFFAFYCRLFFTKKIINNVAFRHRSDVYATRLMDLRNR